MSSTNTDTSKIDQRAPERDSPQESDSKNLFLGLEAVESISLLGNHDGIMDDEVFEILMDSLRD